MRTILLICGELSGDLYAAQLALSLKKYQDVRVVGIGGAKLKDVADEMVYQSSGDNAIGFLEWYKNRVEVGRFKRFFIELINSRDFDHAIIIDYQHMNVYLGALLKRYGISISTFVTPNFWMLQDHKNAKLIVDYSQHIYTIFPQEFRFYKIFSPKVSYFGHPMTTLYQETCEPMSDIPADCFTIGVLPGSRTQELNYYLDHMVQGVLKLKREYPGLSVAVRISDSRYQFRITKAFYPLGDCVRYYDRDDNQFFLDSHIVLLASGSSTIETLLRFKPMVVLAALSSFTYFVLKNLYRIKIRYIALPNIIAQKRVVTELVQSHISADNIALAIKYWISEYQPEQLKVQYEEVLSKLRGEPDVFQAVADHVVTSACLVEK